MSFIHIPVVLLRLELVEGWIDRFSENKLAKLSICQFQLEYLSILKRDFILRSFLCAKKTGQERVELAHEGFRMH